MQTLMVHLVALVVAALEKQEAMAVQEIRHLPVHPRVIMVVMVLFLLGGVEVVVEQVRLAHLGQQVEMAVQEQHHLLQVHQ
jgi:hypothetical protein